jgi:predicted acyl esterase
MLSGSRGSRSHAATSVSTRSGASAPVRSSQTGAVRSQNRRVGPRSSGHSAGTFAMRYVAVLAIARTRRGGRLGLLAPARSAISEKKLYPARRHASFGTMARLVTDIEAWVRRVAGVVVLAALVVPPTAAAEEVTTQRVEIPVSDGTVLRGTLRLPAGPGRRPAIVELTPYSGAQGYGRDAGAHAELAESGFATLLVDVRGTGVSSGDFCFLCAKEPQDGADVVEWVARQAFSDGRVAMMGYSYGAVLAARTATLRPPHLAAIAAGSTYNDAYRDIAYPCGLLSLDSVGLAALFSGIPYSRGNRDAGP